MNTTRALVMMTLSTLAAGSGLACSSSSSPGAGGTVDAGQDAVAVADTGTSADTGSGEDSGAAADTGSVTRDDAGCIVVVNEAPLVQEMNVASAPPTPAGGTIPDGTYFVTAATIYTGADGGSGATGGNVQEMSQVSGGGTVYALVAGVGTGASMTNGTLATSGASLTITQTCPSGAGASPYKTFDSDGTKVTVYTSTAPVNALTFTKQ